MKKTDLVIGKEYCLTDLVNKYSLVKTNIRSPLGFVFYKDNNFRYFFRKLEDEKYRLEIKFK